MSWPLIAFAFDEPRAGAVEDVLDDVCDGKTDGYVTIINIRGNCEPPTNHAHEGSIDRLE